MCGETAIRSQSMLGEFVFVLLAVVAVEIVAAALPLRGGRSDRYTRGAVARCYCKHHAGTTPQKQAGKSCDPTHCEQTCCVSCCVCRAVCGVVCGVVCGAVCGVVCGAVCGAVSHVTKLTAHIDTASARTLLAGAAQGAAMGCAISAWSVNLHFMNIAHVERARMASPSRITLDVDRV